MRKSGLILILLLGLLICYCFPAQAAFTFYIGEYQAELSTPLAFVNGNILVPISALEDYLAVNVEVNNGKDVKLEFPTITISMQVGEINALVNGVEQLLEVPPKISNGEVMVPLRFIADLLRFRINFNDQQKKLTLVLTEDMASYVASKVINPPSKNNPPLSPEIFSPSNLEQRIDGPDLKEIVFLDGPRSRVYIDVQGYTAYNCTLLTNPDRLVVDLVGITGDPLPVMELNSTIIQRIRSSRFNDNTIRIVLDLNESTHYTVHRWPSGGLEIEFNYQIGDISFYRDTKGQAKLSFIGTDQPPFQTTSYFSPTRLSLDFQDTTLIGGYQEFKIDDPRVKQMRVSQYTPTITRVVLELTSSIIPISTKKVNGRYEVLFYDGTSEEYQDYSLEHTEEYAFVEVEPEEVLAEVYDANQPLKGRIIAIDPGHGGSDPGAVGPGGTFEKDVVLDVALKLGQLLEDAGARVIMTRIDDRYVSIFDRPVVAEMVKADILLSIHCNSYEGEAARGVETLYSPLFLENFRLAQAVQTELVSKLQLNDRGLRPRTNLAVLNGTSMPSILVEVGFISHPVEEKMLSSPEFRGKVADSLFGGIVRFFLQQK